MKIHLLLLFTCCMGVYATETYSQETKITLTYSNSTIKEVLHDIEQKTNYLFLYNEQEVDVNRKVSFTVREKPVKDILSLLFRNTEINYIIEKRNIVLTKRSIVQQSAHRITGRVTDENEEPVIGATIKEKGTGNGVITDVNGRYSITVSPKATLQISYVGFIAQEISVGNKTQINVIMKENLHTLDEVVVVGYGTARRRDLTGSVASVSGNQLKDIPVTSAAQAIVGRMPGVQVTKTEGSPDSEIKIRIRGGGSLTQDNSPLYIVDGFPVDNINDISPSDIASIDVLKDASSTAIYGARGANGVVIITTKEGFEGKPKVSYNMYYGFKEVTSYYDVLDPYDYVFWQFELQHTSSSFERYYGKFEDMHLYKDVEPTKWQEDIFGRTGTSMYNNLSVSGGSKTAKYSISLTRNDEKEVMIGSGYDRTNLNIKTNFQINKWLNLDLNTRMSDHNLKGAGTSSNGRLAHMVQFRPVNGLSDYVDPNLAEGDFEAWTQFILNPLKQTQDDYRRLNTQAFNFNGAVNIQLFKDLAYRFEGGIQFNKRKENRFYGINTSNVINYGKQPIAEKRHDDGYSYRIANLLTYTKKDFLPGNNMTVVLGQEINYAKSDMIRSTARYFPKDIKPKSALSMMSLGTADPIVTSDGTPVTIASFFGRINYDYKSKYLVSATLRADGSSKFAPGNRWGYFPSAGLAWRISDESFMEGTKSWISDLKLRLSYGQSGNNRIASDSWKKTFSVFTGKLFIDGNETSRTPYLSPNTVFANPDLKWETTTTRNLGLDFSLFNQRLSGSVELYKNTTSDLLISATIPANTGYDRQLQNIGKTSNKGVEFTLNWTAIQNKDFRLTTAFNIGFNKNKIEKLGTTKSWEQSSNWAGADGPTGDYYIYEGGEIGLMYGYQTDGMYSFDDFDYNNGKYIIKQGVPNNSTLIGTKWFGPGALKFVNQNPDEGTTQTEKDLINAKDKVVIGNANPKHTGGFTLTAEYKGFDLSAFFNWVYGNDIYNANKLNFSNYWGGRLYKNILQEMNTNDRFINVDPSTGKEVTNPAQLKELNKGAKYWSAAMNRAPLHSWVIEDGSFLRLNTLTFGYSLPKKVLAKLRLEQLRFYVSGYNLWIWTDYSGYDPEVDAIRSTPLTPGIDYNAYPRSRSFIGGFNLTF